jgi:hypothetical protein
MPCSKRRKALLDTNQIYTSTQPQPILIAPKKRALIHEAITSDENVCILGPVGCGKTAFTRLLMAPLAYTEYDMFASSDIKDGPFPSLVSTKSHQLVLVDDADALSHQQLTRLIRSNARFVVIFSELDPARRKLIHDSCRIIELNPMTSSSVAKLLRSLKLSTNLVSEIIERSHGDARIALLMAWEATTFSSILQNSRNDRVSIFHSVGKVLFPRKSAFWPLSDDACTSTFNSYLYYNSSPFISDLREAAIVSDIFSSLESLAPDYREVPSRVLWHLLNARPPKKVPFGFSKPPDCYLFYSQARGTEPHVHFTALTI